MSLFDGLEDERTLLRPPTPELVDSGDDSGAENYDVVPARALLDACAKERERLLPELVRESRLAVVGPVLLRLVAAESRRAREQLSTSFTLRIYTHNSTLHLGHNFPITFRDGYKTPLTVFDLIAWLRERHELAGYQIEDTLVGISFKAAIQATHTAS
jgi:hypothetical protein